MSIHSVLEKIIHHTSFATEAEKHAALDDLDASVDHTPAEGDAARTDWQPKAPDGSIAVAPAALMTAAQADEMISLLKAQSGPSGVAPAHTFDTPPQVPSTPAPEPPSSVFDQPTP